MSGTVAHMKKTANTRRTPAQDHAVSVVAANPGIRPWAVAKKIGPNGSSRYGYAALHRAEAAGRIRIERDSRGWGSCYVAEGA